MKMPKKEKRQKWEQKIEMKWSDLFDRLDRRAPLLICGGHVYLRLSWRYQVRCGMNTGSFVYRQVLVMLPTYFSLFHFFCGRWTGIVSNIGKDDPHCGGSCQSVEVEGISRPTYR
jgi:hypothetical protein